jgi:DNA replication protein DnaC
VVLLGPAGVGKTYAFYAIIRRLAEKNPEMIAYITTYSEMMTELKSEFVGNSYNEMGSVWDKLNNDSGLYNGILFIDDVSAQKLTDFEVDKMMMFLDKRVNSFSPFVITTNVPLEDFKKVFGDRLASRILGYSTVVEFIGGDNRTKI